MLATGQEPLGGFGLNITMANGTNGWRRHATNQTSSQLERQTIGTLTDWTFTNPTVSKRKLDCIYEQDVERPKATAKVIEVLSKELDSTWNDSGTARDTAQQCGW